MPFARKVLQIGSKIVNYQNFRLRRTVVVQFTFLDIVRGFGHSTNAGKVHQNLSETVNSQNFRLRRAVVVWFTFLDIVRGFASAILRLPERYTKIDPKQ
jgi:hypothetical protein